MKLAGRALVALAVLTALASALETGAAKKTCNAACKKAKKIASLKKCSRCSKCKKKPPPKLECKEKAVDLIFILDGSSSVGPKNFTVAKSFINSIVDKFKVSPKGVKVALLQYSTSPRLEFNLNDHKTKQGVTKAVKNIEWILGDTHTALALKAANKQIVKPAALAKGRGKRRSRFVIVITDGDPQDFKKVPKAVKQLVKSKVKIFAVGVGDATVPELKKLAYTGPKSNAKDVFYADNYQSAKRFVQQLVKLICDNV
jgi:uncharacterized protein YegL